MSQRRAVHPLTLRPVRCRDSRAQPRIAIPDLGPFIAERLASAEAAWI